MARSTKLGVTRRGPVRLLERTGINRGLFGGSKGWFYVGTTLWTLRKVRSLGQRKPEILLREELKPGQRLIVSNKRLTLEADEAVAVGRTVVAAPKRGRRRSKRV